MARVLLVDDDESFTCATKALIEHLGYDVDTAGDVKSAREYLTRHKYQTLLLDLMLPEGSGFDVIEGLPIDRTPDQVAFVTGHSAIKSMVKHLAGPDITYLLKPIDLSQLQALLAPKKAASEAGYQYHFGTLIGESGPMQDLYGVIERVAKTGASVLIQGESGTGKELVAHAIHNASGAQGPLVAANCGAISAELIGSELFGHEKGAFTGAIARKPGLFERANYGTLFLDEVTEMPLEQQPNLLRVLETSKVTRLGGANEITVDCRVISATNRTHDELAQGQYLREDIYFRLAVFPIQLPPLRERKADIPLLCEAFLNELNEQHGTHFALNEASMATLCRYHWPGNVRELRHALHRAFILSDQSNPYLALPSQLGSPFAGAVAAQPSEAAAQSDNGRNKAGQSNDEQGNSRTHLAVGTTIEAMERELITNTLNAVDGDKPKAADLLGVSLKTLYNRLKQYKQEDL